MKINLSRLRKKAVDWKIYTDRARWYVGYVQLILMFAIWLKSYDIDLVWWHYFVLLICTVFGLILVGFLETKLGILKEEQHKYSKENPAMVDIIQQLKEISDKIKN